MAKLHSFWFTPKGFAALALIGAVTYFLLMEHRQHLFSALPFLIIILLCPLMHLFMHGGHGHGGHDHSGENDHDHSSPMDSEAYRQGLEEGRKQAHETQRGDGRR